MRSLRVMWLSVVTASCLLQACRDTELPPPVVLGPGTVRATLLTAKPGRAELEPAQGATVTLLGSTLTATADADGNVLLGNLLVTSGRLLFALDLDGDGAADQSRLVSLEAVQAGFGRDVNLGQMVLSRNATIVGVIKRGDRVALPTGHGGIDVFLPQLPQLAFTGDDGSFTLRGVPEGNLVLSAFTAGYSPQAVALEVAAGQEVRLATLVLEANPGAMPVGRLTGKVRRLDDDSPIAAVQVRLAGAGRETSTQTNAEGDFSFETMPTGVYALALEKAGLRPLRLDGVLVAPGVNDVGTLRLSDGTGTISLDGGPVAPPLDAGLSADAGIDVDAGSTDAGTSDAGTTPDAGLMDAGTTDAGLTDAGTLDAGVDAGFDAGAPGPFAVVGPPQTVARSATVTLSGSASTGDFPLSYRWVQVAGPTVTLSQNDSVTAHSPTFTAPSSAALLEFSLTVTDRVGRVSSNSAVARVSVSSPPVARFVPDGGLFFGGQTLQLQSTSFDDAGLVLVHHDWRLASGSAATLVADGGPLAQVTFTPLMPGDADRLARVELSVTNAVGATSPTFARDFTVRAGATTNWSVTAAPLTAVNVGTTPPTINLSASLSLPVGAPVPSVSWSCSPPQALTAADTLTPSFVAPVVNGPQTQVTCTVLATGAPPLQPLVSSSVTSVALNDTRLPGVATAGETSRIGPWGRTVRFTEPMSSANLSSTGCSGGTNSYALIPVGSWAVPSLTSLIGAGSCSSLAVTGTDRASNNLPTTQLGAFVSQVVWEGPFVSTDTYDDPRPVVVAVSQAPLGTHELSGTSNASPGVELIATSPGVVHRFAIDALVADAGCLPGTCALTATDLAMPWLPAGAGEVGIRRTYAAGGSMFVSFRGTDGGTVLLERLPGGAWQGPQVAPGWPFSSRAGGVTHLDAVEFNADAGALDRWRWDPVARVWNRGERVATGLSSVAEATGNERQVVALVGPTRTLTAWTFGINPSVNATTPAWYNFPTPAELASAPAMKDIDSAHLSWGTNTIFTIFHRRTNGSLGLYRLFDLTNLFGNSYAGDRTWNGNASAPIPGFDSVTRGELLIGVRAEGGNLYLSTLDYNAMSNFSSPSTTFAGPTRPGPGPYSQILNADLACEAAYPRLTLADDRLFITWQERCAPQTRWRVVMRVVR